MELHDVKNWAYDKLDNSIIFTKKEIIKLESEPFVTQKIILLSSNFFCKINLLNDKIFLKVDD